MSSPIENLFEEIFGFKPRKKGVAYEMLAAAVCKVLSKHSEVFHDKKVRGGLGK